MEGVDCPLDGMKDELERTIRYAKCFVGCRLFFTISKSLFKLDGLNIMALVYSYMIIIGPYRQSEIRKCKV